MKLARDDWPRLLSLLDQALELPPASRGEWLRRLDLNDALKLRLQTLLADRRAIETGEFLKALPAVAGPDAALHGRLAAGSMVGPYRLLRELGQGGMSTVWLAERADEQLRRQVALKLPHAGPGQELLARRMLRERDILAGLEHPNIARLYDVGVSESGLPFLVMEYVEGVDLLAYADAQRLSVPRRLKLFLQVLRAVQYAHGKLLLHRDLKPGNILVNAAGEVKLLDFGIAKVLAPDDASRDATELTRAAGQPLTLMYASPEQVLGLPLTTACDVYALGVVLYELVCGARPYDLTTSSAAQVEDAVLHQEPVAPSRRRAQRAAVQASGSTAAGLPKALASDLDAIVLRALSKRSEQRYASIDALSADLARCLAGQPVLAHAPGVLYHLGKFVRRHRLGFGLGGAMAALLISTGSLAVFKGLEAQREGAKAIAARDFMTRLFEDNAPDLSRGRELSGKELLERGRTRLLSGGEATSRLPVDELLASIANAQYTLGDHPSVDATLAELIARLGAPEQAAKRADAWLARTNNALAMSHQAEAKAFLAHAREDAQATNLAPGSLRDLARLSGVVALHDNDLVAARASFLRYFELAAGGAGEPPLHLLVARLGLAKVESLAGRQQESFGYLRAARVLVNETPALRAAQFRELARYQANIEVDWGRYALAHGWLPRTIADCDLALGPTSDACLSLKAQDLRILLKLGRLDEASRLAPALQAWADDDRAPGRQLEATVAMARTAAATRQQGKLATLTERLAHLAEPSQAIELTAQSRQQALNTLAELSLHAHRPTQALYWTGKARELANSTPQAATREALKTGLFEGVALQAQGRHAAALTAMSSVCDEQVLAASRLQVLDRLFSLNCARSLVAEGRREEATALVRRALPVLEQGLGAEAPTLARARRLLREVQGDAEAPRPPKAAELPELFS